jgi:hypothetical protein
VRRGPRICEPCTAFLHFVSNPEEGEPYWRCSWCGRRRGRGAPAPHAHVAPPSEQRGVSFISFPWEPRPGAWVIVEEGAQVWHLTYMSCRTVPPSSQPYLVTLQWVRDGKVIWRDADGEMLFVRAWEVLPALSPVELLSRAHAQERT